MPLPETSQIFISLFSPGFFGPSIRKVTAKHMTVFFVDVRWCVIMWSLLSPKEQVGTQTVFHWQPLKKIYTHPHTHTVWEKNAPYRGTAVWVAGEDGRMTLAMLQARGQSMTQQCGNIFTHLQMCLSPLDRIKPTLMDAAWNKNLERINSDL